MEPNQSAGDADEALAEFLRSEDDREAEQILPSLITNTIEPVVKNVIRHRLGVFLGRATERAQERDAEDLYSEVILQVLVRLRELREDFDGQRVILNLKSYVAGLAHHVCSDYFRKKNPQRRRLWHSLRYLLSHHASFAVWEGSQGECICGLSGWLNRPATSRADLEAIMENEQVRQAAARDSMADMVGVIFRQAGSPLELDSLVAVSAALLGVKERTAEDPDVLTEVVDQQRSILQELEQQAYIRTLWSEIVELPVKQRQALLFSLRDRAGGSLLPLIPATGVAPLKEIAEVLEMSLQQILELWNSLPLEDAILANRLGITRQQVINLRKSARERLTRRMNQKE